MYTNRTRLTDSQRQALAENRALGCGNFLHVAAQINAGAAQPLFFLNQPHNSPWESPAENLSLAQVKAEADRYAAWYASQGIGPKDPVAVYINEGIANLIHYVALTGIGAIPILINGNMRPHIAARFLEKAGALALFTDPDHLPLIGPHLNREKLSFVSTIENISKDSSRSLPAAYPYQHADNDVVLVGHSSGTTGIPKAVIFQHQQFFYGIRYRLGLPRAQGADRILSALPHSHSAGIAYVMLAVLSGTPIMILTDNKPETVLPAIDRFQPSMVVAFPETYVELCESDFTGFDLSSIRLWMNGGDAAHEAHIKKLVSVGTWEKDGESRTGSLFIDGLGSSEMGFSLFRMVHTPETEGYHRCIGKPLEWVDAQIIGENGEKLGPNIVGKLGVKSPSITPGYWNDSALSAKAQVGGYWLTGDLFYRDEDGYFFHVDRIPDAIKTASGMFYSLQNEELLLKHLPEFADCTLIGVPAEENFAAPLALVRLKNGGQTATGALKDRINSVLVRHGRLPVRAALAVDPRQVPLGPTGKVLKRELRDQYRNFFQKEAP